MIFSLLTVVTFCVGCSISKVVSRKEPQIHLLMSMFGISSYGQFKEWNVENSANYCAIRTWHLQWRRRMVRRDLRTLFPGYVQRHVDGSCWKPKSVGYYVFE